ncbi:MAG: N-6 DNA methylase [Anaerolineales bacterium]
MDDMDKQSIEMGGKASFFKGKFAKYGWSNIFDPRLGGQEMLALYGEAITSMSQNENLPQLFRDIFKNAFLPYRDPETLKLFLKTINDFKYDHSEKLGDAFEYLLSVLGSQGDAGQFRTPRHIIDFMVQVLDPKKTDTVLDPACGTAGFLISAYKHIAKTSAEAGKPLTTQEKTKIYDNFTGYDISPDMVRLSLVNLYLHGFVKPQIFEYDTLTSDDRWSDYADVILANPPFMSPKGGIQPHKRFSVQSNRSEVLFVDYMAEHLTSKGRAAIIVPEGIIFQSAGAYKQLRKYLIEHNFLWAVVSLPAGMFNPYAGVKTSILLLDKNLAKKTDKVLFVKIEKDGYDLGAQRRALCNEMGDKPEHCPKHSDLPSALATLQNWHKAVLDGEPASFSPMLDSALLVPVSKLAEGDYNLSADRYREVIRNENQKSEMVPLIDVCELIIDGDWVESKDQSDFGIRLIQTGNVGFGKYKDKGDKARFISEEKFIELNCTEIFPGDVLISRLPDPVGRACFVPKLETRMITAVDCSIVRFNKTKILPEYFVCLTLSDQYYKELSQYLTGASRQRISRKNLEQVKIPLLPIETQHQIVDEIAGYQRVIDGARQIVEGWKPNIEIELGEMLPKDVTEWISVRLEEVCENITDGKHGDCEDQSNSGYYFISAKDIKNGLIDYSDVRQITKADFEDTHRRTRFELGDILLSNSGSIGKMAVAIDIEKTPRTTFQKSVAILKPKQDLVTSYYLFYFLQSKNSELNSVSDGSSQKNLLLRDIRAFEIPLPPLEVQREIVTRIERERSIVEGNRELIRIYEEKVKKVIERVWEG